MRRVKGPGVASPRALPSPVEDVDFRQQAFAVLSRRSRRDLAAASDLELIRGSGRVRRVHERQRVQLTLLMERGAL